MNHVPVTFLLDVGDEDIASWRNLCPDREAGRLVLGEHYWIAATHARLRDAGAHVRLENRVPDEGIAVFYAGDKRRAWEAARRGSRALMVAVRSDRNPVGFADVEVVQNATSARGPRTVHIAHWPQPGLVPRDASRGPAVRTILFPGTPQNLHPDFSAPAWREAMRARGIDFRCSGGDAVQAWQDCSDVDLMLAIRPGGEIRNKPAWKLFNAWLAGTPAILGPEWAYRELRRGDLDYIEALDGATALAAVDRLRESPGLYAAMVANGLERGREHCNEAVAGAWRSLIDDVLVPAQGRLAQRPVTVTRRRLREVVARIGRMRGAR